jgi:hypothetical protein
MAKRAVMIARELWTEILTTGWHAEHIECVEGIPEGAFLVGAFLRIQGKCVLVFEHGIGHYHSVVGQTDMPELVLVFEHPDWKPIITETRFTVETPGGEQVLVISPTHRIVYREDA